MPTDASAECALMDRVSRELPAIGEHIAWCVGFLTGAPMDVVVIAWTTPRASWGCTCTREQAIAAIDVLVDRWKHPNDPSYGRVEFGKASEPVKRMAMAGTALMQEATRTFDVFIKDPVPFSVLVLADSGPSYFGKAHRSEVAPHLEALSAYMKSTAGADDVPAHEFRDH
jgi:hypothetical protein